MVTADEIWLHHAMVTADGYRGTHEGNLETMHSQQVLLILLLILLLGEIVQSGE